MKLSTRTRYGLRLMVELAARGQQEAVMLREIAQAQGISHKYLSQIILLLKSRGLVNAWRGARGGYRLSRPAEQIRVREVVEALEDGLTLLDCVDRPGACPRSGRCAARDLWEGLGREMARFLDSVTLQDMVGRQTTKQQGEISYSI